MEQGKLYGHTCGKMDIMGKIQIFLLKLEIQFVRLHQGHVTDVMLHYNW